MATASALCCGCSSEGSRLARTWRSALNLRQLVKSTPPDPGHARACERRKEHSRRMPPPGSAHQIYQPRKPGGLLLPGAWIFHVHAAWRTNGNLPPPCGVWSIVCLLHLCLLIGNPRIGCQVFYLGRSGSRVLTLCHGSLASVVRMRAARNF